MRKTVPAFAPFALLALLAPFLFASCLGASMDISLRPDGSGRIVLEYRVSRMLESLGRFDGNERWHAIPVGRADLERSLARIPGMRLVSFSSAASADSADGASAGDLVTRAELEFANPAALVAFIDFTGSRAEISRENGANRLRVVLLDPCAPIEDADLLSLMGEISSGYEIRIGLGLPGAAGLETVPATVPGARREVSGGNVSFAIDTGQIPQITDGLALEVSW